MRLMLKLDALILWIIIGIFFSCSKPEMKQSNRFTPQTPSSSSLSGQEFLFDSLTWIFFDGRFDIGIDDIYLKTSPRADVFPWLTYTTYINAAVFMKFDTASNWIDVKSIDLYEPSMPVQYMYWVHLNSLFVHIHPLNYQLIGRKAAIKIKFL